ncbi:MAG: MbnP family protein, partial [Haliscomenobacter sp.]
LFDPSMIPLGIYLYSMKKNGYPQRPVRGIFLRGSVQVLGVALLLALSPGRDDSAAFMPEQGRSGRILFAPIFEGEALELGREYALEGGADSIRLETLRFYLSHPRLLRKGRVVFAFPESAYLMDMAEPASLALSWSAPRTLLFDQVAFELGVDSLTQAGGARGAALDPIRGMYWSWQSGYIHVKLEGTATASKARHFSFQYHLGGYRAPFNTIRTLVLPARPRGDTHIHIALDAFFEAVDLAATPDIMRPCPEAMQAVRSFADAFKTVP